MSSSKENEFKIVITGASGTGKTNFVNRLARNTFDSKHDSTIGVEFASKIITIKNKVYNASIWDSSGLEKFRSITNAYLRGAQGILLFYDVTDQASFDEIPKWLNDAEERTNLDTVIMLIGNKIDKPESERKISTSQGEDLAKSYRLLFNEISVLNSTNVDEAFTQLIKKIIKKQNKKHQKEKETSKENQSKEKVQGKQIKKNDDDDKKKEKTPNSILLTSSNLKKHR